MNEASAKALLRGAQGWERSPRAVVARSEGLAPLQPTIERLLKPEPEVLDLVRVRLREVPYTNQTVRP